MHLYDSYFAGINQDIGIWFVVLVIVAATYRHVKNFLVFLLLKIY